MSIRLTPACSMSVSAAVSAGLVVAVGFARFAAESPPGLPPHSAADSASTKAIAAVDKPDIGVIESPS
jgi:hypothetical protein